MELKSKIILLNGPSSAGKTSLVKSIQYLSEEPWLTFGIDDCLDAMPDKYVGRGEKTAEGFHFVSSFDKEGFPITEVKTGSYGKRVSSLVPKMIQLMVDSGFNIIVDEVIWERKDLEQDIISLKGRRVYLAKINCELSLMKEREILRGDRFLGMAQAQHVRMKDLKWDYDLEIDTGQVSPFDNAQKILIFIKENEPWAFVKNN